MDTTTLEAKLENWKEKVIDAHRQGYAASTYHMMVDIDKIIAEAFDRTPCIEEVY